MLERTRASLRPATKLLRKTNRSGRRSPAGPVMLLLQERYSRCTKGDHHGFGALGFEGGASPRWTGECARPHTGCVSLSGFFNQPDWTFFRKAPFGSPAGNDFRTGAAESRLFFAPPSVLCNLLCAIETRCDVLRSGSEGGKPASFVSNSSIFRSRTVITEGVDEL